MGTVAGGRVTYYHAAYLQLRLSANDPVIHFLKQAEVTLKYESEFKALLSNTKPDTRAALLNIWNGGHGGPVVDPDNNPGPSSQPPTVIEVEPLICGCAVQPMLPVNDNNFYVPDEYTEFENHSIKELSFYLYDHLGNTRMTYRILPTSDATFTVEEMMDYDPYGKILRHYSAGGEKYLTTQHQRDTETGLDYRGVRFYDCDVARFLSVDPLAVKYPSMSGYMYVGGMPTMAVDPDGRKIKVFYHDSDGKRQKVVIKDWEKRNEVLGKISNVFVQNVKEAFDYLDEYDKASGNNILSKIAGSNRSVKIRESEVQNVDQYNSLTNIVKWDPLSGLEVTSPQDERSINPATDQVYSFSDNSSKPAGQTPAGGLYGELVHGYRDLFEKVESFVDAMISDPLWDNRDERKTNDIEAKVAKLSPKEAVRQKESDYARRVSCPICNR